jgi:BON domain
MWTRSLGLMLAIVLSAAGTLSAQTPDDKRTVEDLRAAVLRLPYYGVFDAVSVNYDKGTATLTGFVYQTRLKEDIVNAVKRVARVDDVVDQIEVLPVSRHDDELRWRTFAHIYGDSVLSRYAAGGGLSRFDLYDMLRFPGTEPFGNYGIKIIVNRGRITLVGLVDSTFDKTIAGHRAREIPGAFGVENALVVASSTSTR